VLLGSARISTFSDWVDKDSIRKSIAACSSRPSVGKDGITYSMFLNNQDKEIDLILKKLKIRITYLHRI